jgi:hypothetical protein
MKYHCRSFRRGSVYRAGFAFFLSLVVPAAWAAGEAPSDQGVPLEIDVRSTVDPRWQGVHKLGAAAHGKLYLLAAVKEVPSVEKIFRPVDQAALVAQLRQELAAQGFREINATQKPEVVLTVTYGRGFLRNPYLDGAQVDELTPGGPPTSTIVMAKQAARQREAGFEAKVQKAQMEKLYIAVTAWQYPDTKGEKPHQFWRTVMVVDNPDGRDLNLAMPAMLAAGVRYFDQDIKDDQVTINSTMPAGTVKLAPLEVIETDVDLHGKK